MRYRELGRTGGYAKLIEQIGACNDCGLCLERCPHDLPTPQMPRNLIAPVQDIPRIWDETGYWRAER